MKANDMQQMSREMAAELPQQIFEKGLKGSPLKELYYM